MKNNYYKKQRGLLKYVAATGVFFLILFNFLQTRNMIEPKATQKQFTHKMHGDNREDTYYWLKERENPEVISYLKSENNYRQNGMQVVKELEDELYLEMTERLNPDESSVPVQVDDYWYQTRFESGNDYPIYYRRKGSIDSPENIVLDVNILAADRSYCQVSGLSMTRDHERMAYGVDYIGRRLYTLHFMDLKDNKVWDFQVEGTSGAFAWADDGETFFYGTKDPITLRSDKIWRQKIGSDSSPVLVYHEKDDTFSCSVYRSKSKKYIHISTGATNVDELHYLPSDNPMGEFATLREREMGVEYSASHFNGHWYILSNIEERPNFALFRAGELLPKKWIPFIEHRDDVLLEGIDLFKDFLVSEERSNGLLNLIIRPWEGDSHSVSLPEETYTLYTGSNPTEDTESLRFVYTSLISPATTYDYNMRTREKKILKQTKIIGGYDSSKYISYRFWATAFDGTKIPISWVGPKESEGKSIPTLLYGYGSYGITIDPGFSISRLSLLERGMAFAIAHVRGGQYMGREWYLDGRMENKTNSFNDFILCGEFLKESGYSSELYAMGGSAGGLLMGAIVNMRPKLWSGVIAAVPFVDVVTTMLDESIPLTTGEYSEWGNPNDSDVYFRLKSYSPYDNVTHQDYPPLLITTGLHDSQVQYWEPAKWIARLREMRNNNEPLYMHCNMETGHSGATGRYQAYRETAMEYSFLLGLKEGLFN